MYKIKRYFQGVLKQAKMVRWPSRKDLLVSVSVVLVIVAFSALMLALDDFIVSQLLQELDRNFASSDSTTSEAVAMLFNILR